MEEKRIERYRDTVDEYYGFANDFPESKYLKEAQGYLAKSFRHFFPIPIVFQIQPLCDSRYHLVNVFQIVKRVQRKNRPVESSSDKT